MLLLPLTLAQDLDELVHRVRDAENGEKEDDQRLTARPRSWGRGRSLDGLPVDELSELPLQLIRRSTGYELLHPSQQSEKAEDATESVPQLPELLDHADHGEEGRVRGHEGRLEHLRDTGEGLHDGVEKGERVLGGALEGLTERLVGRIVAHGPEHPHSHPRHTAVHAVHPVASESAVSPHASVHVSPIGRVGVSEPRIGRVVGGIR